MKGFILGLLLVLVPYMAYAGFDNIADTTALEASVAVNTAKLAGIEAGATTNPPAINLDGSSVPTANIPMGGFSITNINSIVLTNEIYMSMNKGITWVQDSTNYFRIVGLSPTSGVTQFTVDGVTSNKYWNMVE